MSPRRIAQAACVAVATAAALLGPALSYAQQKLVFATNWKAQGSHGGFYQAVADGTYKRFGLDVEIMQGGPQANPRPLMLVGKVDLMIPIGMIAMMEANKSKLPTTLVAAFLQKDPTSLMAHAGVYKNFDDLKNAKTVYIAKASQFSFWKWLTASRGFTDAQFKQYNYSAAPFLADKTSLQQAYVTAEPIYLGMEGVKTDVFMLADQGWEAYANLIEARRDMVEKNPALNDEKLEAEVAKLQQMGMVDSGDARTKGIGALSIDRVKRFTAEMVKAGVFAPNDIDVGALATDRFVNKGVGLDVRAKFVK